MKKVLSLTICSLFLVACGEGTDPETETGAGTNTGTETETGTNPETGLEPDTGENIAEPSLAEISGIWDLAETFNGEVDQRYSVIKDNEHITYDYIGDSLDKGAACYLKYTDTITDLGNGSFEISNYNDSSFSSSNISITESNITFTGSFETISFPKASMEETDLVPLCDESDSSFTAKADKQCGLVSLAACRLLNSEIKKPKVLLIVVDGLRPDVLATSATPNIDTLKASSLYSDNVRMHYPTISGNGWTSILTGTRSDKHGVINNKENHFNVYAKSDRKALYPVLPDIIESHDAQLNTASFVKWPKINQFLNRFAVDEFNIKNDEASGLAIEGKTMKLADTDQNVIDVSVEKLSQGNPDFLFVGLNGTDSAGHDFGFRATIPEYVSAIKQVDGWIGDLTAAVKAREQYANEDWLVLVSTDHGGGAKQAKKHAEGQQADEEGGFVNSTIFIYASRDGQPAQQLEGLRQVDVAPTVLHHLGISIPEHYEGIALQQILTNNQMD